MSKVLARSQKDNGKMLKIEDSTVTKGYVWYFMSDDVIKFVDSNDIRAGVDVEIKTEEVNGDDTITFLKKIGNNEPQFKCKACGKTLKDDKYETCYECSKKAGSSNTTQKTYGKTPEEQESIKKQALGKMTAVTLTALEGVTINNVLGFIDTIYAKYQEKIG